jgi:hypothetical protein
MRSDVLRDSDIATLSSLSDVQLRVNVQGLIIPLRGVYFFRSEKHNTGF